jgi:ABC-2 type transport system permease protein
VVLVVLLSSRLYSGSLLRTGGKVALSAAWSRGD